MCIRDRSELIIRKRDSGLLQSFLELKDGEENFIADVLAVTDMLAPVSYTHLNMRQSNN